MKLFCSLALSLCFFATGIQSQAQPPGPEPGTNAANCELTADDYAIFTAVVQNLGAPEDPEEAWAGKEILIVRETAKTSKGDFAWSGWGMRSISTEKPRKGTIENFRERSSVVCAIEAQFADPHQYTLIQQDELDRIFKAGVPGWETFYKKYPKAAGYWSFSRPGFNRKIDEAVLYVGHSCGGLCGTGHLFLLRKQEGKWRVVARSMLWIS